MNDLYVGAYWGQRKESADECAERLASCMRRLAETDEALSAWYRKSRSKQDARQQPIEPGNRESIVDLLQAGTNKRDTDRSIIEDLGFGVGLWNGLDGDQSASMSVTCGLYARNLHLRNSVALDFPKHSRKLASKDHALAALAAVIESWEPEWAGVISKSSRTLRPFSPGSPFVDWMFYRSGLHLEASQLPAPASVVRIGDLGCVVITQDSPVDAQSNDDLQNVHAVEATLSI